MDTLKDIHSVLQYMDENAFVAPGGIYWDQIYKLLPTMDGKNPDRPLVLSGWHYSTDNDVRDRFIAHLNWAERAGILPHVLQKFSRLKPGHFYEARPNNNEDFV